MYHPTETASLKNKYYMAVHSRLNAFSFDIYGLLKSDKNRYRTLVFY
jgi:hypothetical protein